MIYKYTTIFRNFPDFYYYKEFPVNKAGTVTVGIVMIDTVLLCGNSDDHELEQPRGPKVKSLADQQWAFIEKSLANSKSVIFCLL